MNSLAFGAVVAWPLVLVLPATAAVKYDEGRMVIDGVQLLQDDQDANAYYYVPQFPRLSRKADGRLELLMVKYTDRSGETSGGLFHALVEFGLPEEMVADLEKKLQARKPGAHIDGQVRLLQATEDGDDGVGSFRIISSTLSEQGGLTRSLITSGVAPLSSGSKAAVAASLSPHGATLLWESLQSPTSDVSVAIRGYYEAMVEGYNATVSAEMETLYTHASQFYNQQQGSTRRHVRAVVDRLQREGILDVQIVDRSQGLGISTGRMAAILDIVTERLADLMFDHESGWSTEPPRTAAIDKEIALRLERSWFSRTFGRTRDTPYYTDDQYVIKNRRDIRQNRFYLNLSQRSSVRVPIDTAGNLAGLYADLQDAHQYFRLVDLSDPDFETRQVYFQLDGGFVDAFWDTINFVSVNIRRVAPDQEAPAFTKSIHFTYEEVRQGSIMKEISFSRLGRRDPDWVNFEYQVRWGLSGREQNLRVPPGEGEWIETGDSIIALVPPFRKREVEVQVLPEAMDEAGLVAVNVRFVTVLGGQGRLARNVTIRAGDAEWSKRLSIYHDPDNPIAYQAFWYGPDGEKTGPFRTVESPLIFLTPPTQPGESNQ